MKRAVPFFALGWIGLMLACGVNKESNQPAPAKPAVTDLEARVAGQLLGPNGQSLAGRPLLLITVRLVDLKGKEIAELHPEGTAIMDANVAAPDATAQTDASGRFEFKGVKPGRYSIALRSAAGAGQVSFLQSPQDNREHLIFDVTSGQGIDLGKVNEAEK